MEAKKKYAIGGAHSSRGGETIRSTLRAMASGTGPSRTAAAQTVRTYRANVAHTELPSFLRFLMRAARQRRYASHWYPVNRYDRADAARGSHRK